MPVMAPKKKPQPRGSWAWRLQKLRERRGWSLKDMAGAFDISVHTLTGWLYGRNQPSIFA